MKATYTLTENQMDVREELKALLTMLNSVEIKNVNTGDRCRISQLLESEERIPYSDVQYEVGDSNKLER